MALGEYPKGRPIVGDFASKQIDDTALFNFTDGTKPVVLYGGVVPLNVGFHPFDTSIDAIFADEDAADDISYFHGLLRRLVVVDLGRYRAMLQSQTLAGNGDKPEPLYIQSSALAKDALQLNVYGVPGKSGPAATFQVLFRFYPDGTQIGTLNEGEVALFQQCNYQGKAAVFAVDIANFAELDSSVITLDNTAASVKLGNNTAALLYSAPVYTGARTVIKTDTPCLPSPPNTTSLLVRPLDHALELGSRDCTNCRLVGANLSGLDLSGYTLTGADLSNADLTCTSFAGTDNENRVDLTATTLTGAKFGTDSSCRTDFNWTIINADSIPPAQWKFVNLNHANITGLAGKVLSSEANPLDLAGAMLSGASLQDAILDYATGLSGATLIGTKFPHASLQHVDLSNASLSNATLDRANLEGSNLSGAILSPCAPPANCSGATLREAHLKNVNLSGSHLESAIFDNANFYSSRLVGGSSCDVSSTLCASANGATMTGTQFTGAYLAGTDFGNTNMHGVAFDGAVLVGANFAGATVSPLPDQVNGSFYEGVCQAPLNSDVQWFSGLSPPCAVFVMSYP